MGIQPRFFSFSSRRLFFTSRCISQVTQFDSDLPSSSANFLACFLRSDSIRRFKILFLDIFYIYSIALSHRPMYSLCKHFVYTYILHSILLFLWRKYNESCCCKIRNSLSPGGGSVVDFDDIGPVGESGCAFGQIFRLDSQESLIESSFPRGQESV